MSGVVYSNKDGVARVTIDRPERLNAIDDAAAALLGEIWQAIENDHTIRVVVLTGAGDRSFSAGADLKSGGDLSSLEYWATQQATGFGGIAMRETLKVPIIARVNGYALGGGFEMVLGCDIVVAADHASFGLPEPKVGRIALGGGMTLISKRLTHVQAMGILLTGRRLLAAEASTLGLVNEVVPGADLDKAVDRWIDQIRSCAPLALAAIKAGVSRGDGLNVREMHALKTPELIAALLSEDQHEGVKAFGEKRVPVWKGR